MGKKKNRKTARRNKYDQAMVDAIREMLGMKPLYRQESPTDYHTALTGPAARLFGQPSSGKTRTSKHNMG